jgi:hypothetical protein
MSNLKSILFHFISALASILVIGVIMNEIDGGNELFVFVINFGFIASLVVFPIGIPTLKIIELLLARRFSIPESVIILISGILGLLMSVCFVEIFGDLQLGEDSWMIYVSGICIAALYRTIISLKKRAKIPNV